MLSSIRWSSVLFIVAIVLELYRLKANSFPALVRKPLKKHAAASLLVSSIAARQGLPAEPFKVPEIGPATSDEPDGGGADFTGRRKLQSGSADPGAVEDDMVQLLADPGSGVNKLMLSYSGRAHKIGPLLVEMTDMDGEIYGMNLTQFSEVVERIDILTAVKIMILKIKSVGKEKRQEIRPLFRQFLETAPVYVVEADSELHPRTFGGPPSKIPRDKFNHLQWAYSNHIKLPVHVNIRRAWQIIVDRHSSLTKTKVAVIDGWPDYMHEDLKNCLWTNHREKLNGADDDGNGCIDDVHGCSFADDESPNGGQPGNYSHATHVMGILGSETNNNKGSSGSAWHCYSIAVMPIGFNLSARDGLSTAVQAIDYAYRMNVRISSNSWGYTAPVPTVETAISAGVMLDHLYITAMNNGNGGNASDPKSAGANDWPPRYMLPNMINVVNNEQSGRISRTSNFGNKHAHLAAPGTDIYSTAPGDSYMYWTGTSMSTPIVAGVASLVLSVFPDMTVLALKRVLLESARKLETLRDHVITEAIPDAAWAIQLAECENEVRRGKQKCPAIYPNPLQLRVWAEAGANWAEELVTNCQAACKNAKCIKTHLITDLCKRRFCDVLNGQCQDRLALASYSTGAALPGFDCEACVERIYGSEVIDIWLVGVVGVKEEDMSGDDSIVSGLTKAIQIAIGVDKIELDAWRIHDMDFGTVEIVYRLTSFTQAKPIEDIVRDLKAQLRSSESKFRSSEYGKEYCNPPVGKHCVFVPISTRTAASDGVRDTRGTEDEENSAAFKDRRQIATVFLVALTMICTLW